MAGNYAALSGQKIIRKIRSRNRGSAIVWALFFCFCILMIVGAFVYALKEGESFLTVLLGALVFGLMMYYAATKCIACCKTLRDVPQCRLFRKYGSPDELAARIAEESGHTMLEDRRVLVTERFIMRHGDFESYVPFDAVLLMYRREHSTNGVRDAIDLVVHDRFGDEQAYQFRMGRKHAGEMEYVMAEIEKLAPPQCRIGYTQDNLNFVKQNAVQIE